MRSYITTQNKKSKESDITEATHSCEACKISLLVLASCTNASQRTPRVLFSFFFLSLTSGTWTERCRRKSWETGSETCTVLNVKDPYRSSIASLDLVHALALLATLSSRCTLPFSIRLPLLPSVYIVLLSLSNQTGDKWQL